MSPNGFSRRSLNGNAKRDRHMRQRRPSGRSRGVIGAFVARMRGAFDWVRDKQQELGWKRFLLRTVGIVGGLCVLYLAFLWFTLPNIRDPKTFVADQSTVITDRNGVELHRVFDDQDRTVIPNEQIPQTMKQAIVAIEDERFYQHGCIDPIGIVRVALGGFQRGASTLTQQLARNAVISSERTLTRKLREMMLACKIERIYSKDEIIGLYLNWVPFGPTVYGIEHASKKYLGKSAKDLTLAESAVLASLPQRPSYLNPYGSHVRTSVSEEVLEKIGTGKITSRTQIPEREISLGLLGNTFGSGANAIYIGGRSDQVLKNMQDQNMITESERLDALANLAKIEFKPDRASIRAPYFTLWVKENIEKMFEGSEDEELLKQSGLVVQTTLDWNLQEIAEDVIASRRDDALERYGAHNIALIAMDPHTKEILAYVGNSNYEDEDHGGRIDMVQVPRQPGSSFKPIVYTSMFERGYGPGTILYDVKTKFGPNEPQNFDGGFWGLVNARRALGGSRNIPAMKAYYLAGGEDAVLKSAAKIGARSPQKFKQSKGVKDEYFGYPLSIGSAEVPLMEMAEAYATIADGGRHKEPVSLLKITDRNKAIRYQADLSKPATQAIDARVAYQTASILSDASVRPGGFWQAALDVPGTIEAAKTGTSNACGGDEVASEKTCTVREPHDLWTMGFTPDLVVGVWVGNADSTNLPKNAESLSVAAPIWKEFLTRVYKSEHFTPKKTAFDVPDGIVQPQISLLSGELPTDCTPIELRQSEIFLKEHAPTLEDPACIQVEVDKVTGLLASDSCPVEAREMRSFLLPKSIDASQLSTQIKADWEAGVFAWAESMRNSTGSLLPIAPTEECDISKTPGRLTRPTLEILFPVDGGSATYPAFTPSIDFTVGDEVESIKYEIDGREILTVTEAPFTPALRLPRSISESGRHKLKVTVTDSYFNQAIEEVEFSFDEDNEDPEVEFVVPSDDISVRLGTSLRMQARATDDSGIRDVELYLDDRLLVRKPLPPFDLVWPLKDVSPGRHTLRAVATDFAGNTGEARREIMVEN